MRSKYGLLKKTAIILIGILIMSFAAVLIGSTGIAGGPEDFSDVTSEQISSKLIRLHVIANSDSPEDQELKLKVRDEIIETLDRELGNVDDINKFRYFITNNLEHIEKIARNVIMKAGKDEEVTAVFGRFPFPVKSYGFVTLPAGEYEALRIIIGSGKGTNWWCVLFPPLCFVDITHSITEEEAKLSIGKVLTADELAAIETANFSKDIPVEVRFKVVDWWEETRDKIDRTIKLAFN
jgi:stage II sporulation protein R